MLEIRAERQQDIDAIRQVNNRAFGRPEEGRIVDDLRNSCDGLISLVALLDDKLVGHILFSPATIDGRSGVVTGMGLAPMAVLPEFQRRGIGSRLVAKGLQSIRNTSCPFVIVLGHEKFYPRFGFERASEYGLKCQWDGVPDNAFMAMILDESVMEGVSGVVKYRNEFDAAT